MTNASPEVTLHQATDKAVLSRLMELYQHDLSAFERADLDEEGRFGYRYLDAYWTEPNRHPFLIRAGGRLAGFVLVNQHTHLAGTEHSIAEFFVARRYRRLGVGRTAALAVLDHFPGVWEIHVHLANEPAQAFWRGVIAAHAGAVPAPQRSPKWSGLLFQFSSPSHAALSTNIPTIAMSQKINNAKALYLEGIRDGQAREAVTRYTGSRYTQHSTGVRDGVEGFVEFFEPFIARNPKRDIQIIRAFEDGQHVFLHAYQSLNDGEAEWITTDFFDTDADDKIIEHWDVIAAYIPETPSGHTSIDGPTEVTDLDRTEANKALVRDMIEDLLMPDGEVSKAGEYIAQDYIQHSSTLADGLGPFERMLNDPHRTVWYREIVLLVGQGNFVATLCRADANGQELAQVDLYRVADGKIAEHWENAEPVPPPEETVNSGKF
ncbi:MAG: GNAT family N-acetyltransferase [Bacteroidota bacterium]